MTTKVILVTGASRGLGLAVSQYLLQNGHTVVAVSRTEAPLDALKKQYPAHVEYVTADLTDLAVSCKRVDFN
jgi:NAD(P)-dependent dehydrogenase (short-subunit alcohol dehydrogenase family)